MKDQFTTKYFNSAVKPKLSLFDRIKSIYYSWCIRLNLFGLFTNNIEKTKKVLSFFTEQRQATKCFAEALYILSKMPSKTEEQNKNIWELIRFVITLIQDQQVNFMIVNPEVESKLINIGIEHKNYAFISHDKAFSLVAFSLWLFERGKIDMAILLSQDASQSDPNWGYGEFMTGWYKLFLGGNGSIEYFNRAVNKDWNFLHRINNDKICKKYPSIIRSVNRNVLVKKSS